MGRRSMSDIVIADTPDAVLMNETKLSILQAVVDGWALYMAPDGDGGNLPDEFAIGVRMTLGDWRRAKEVLRNERAQEIIRARADTL